MPRFFTISKKCRFSIHGSEQTYYTTLLKTFFSAAFEHVGTLCLFSQVLLLLASVPRNPDGPLLSTIPLQPGEKRPPALYLQWPRVHFHTRVLGQYRPLCPDVWHAFLLPSVALLCSGLRGLVVRVRLQPVVAAQPGVPAPPVAVVFCVRFTMSMVFSMQFVLFSC